jgi:mono/diheme cytochrome c family protein
MIRVKKILVLLFVAAMAGYCLVIRPNDKAAAATSTAAGPAEIFIAHCAECHGRDGRARTAKGKRANATDLTSDWNRDEARGIRIITNGKNQMPSFKKKLTAAEIRAVFGYVSRF